MTVWGSFADVMQAAPQASLRSPCKILPNPDSFSYCGRPSGEHTALGNPICDECYEAIRA